MNKKVIVFIILLSLIVIGIITFIYDQISLAPDITINNHYDNIFLEPTTETNVVNIFNNSEFNGENIIAPGSSGIYRFNVANDTKETLKYQLIMSIFLFIFGFFACFTVFLYFLLIANLIFFISSLSSI